MVGLVAMEENYKPLEAFLCHMPLLAILVANPCSARPLVTLAVISTSAALLARSPQISVLSPLHCRLRLRRPPVSPLRLRLLSSMSLQLDLSPPGIFLKLTKCPIR